MKSLLKFVLLAVSVVGLSSFSAPASVALRSLPENPDHELPSESKSRLSCAEIPGALQEYNALARGNESAYSQFIEEVSGTLYNWYDVLAPLEDSSASIPVGAFDPVIDGSDQIFEVVGLVNENSQKLRERMQLIIDSLPSCL